MNCGHPFSGEGTEPWRSRNRERPASGARPTRPGCPARAIILFLVLAWAAPTPLAGQDADGFVPLFDGSGLAGWVVENSDGGNFRVRDGVLVVEGPNGWLRSTRRFSDIRLRIEFRFLTDDSDSGIFLRADGEAQFIRGWPGNSYQVQVRDITTNRSNNPIWLADVYRHRVAEGGETQYDRAAAGEVARPTGEWQELEIEVIGDSLTVWLNGTLVTRADNIVNPSGYIGIQGETGTVEYRSILVREGAVP